jgi:drug/metabolite transporter (DMT)-like permease
VAAGRICLAALLLLVVSRKTVGLFMQLPRREKLLVSAAGLLLGLHFGVWITSLYFTSTAASVALVATQPVFAALFGLTLGDRVARREVAGIAVAAMGCVVLAGGDWGNGRDAIIGDALALAGAAAAAGYLVVGRSMRASLPLLPYLAVVNTVAGIGLATAALFAGVRVSGIENEVFYAVAIMAIVPSLVGHTLLNHTVRRIPTHRVTLAILGEPVGAAMLTWAIFAEEPPVHAALGGAVILAGIGLGFGWRRTVLPSVDTGERE